MKEKINKFRLKLSSNKLLNFVLLSLICLFFSLYVFVFCSFGGRPQLFKISYPVLGLLIFVLVLYCLLFYKQIKIKINWWLVVPALFIPIVLITTMFGTKNYAYFKTITLLTITLYISLLCFLIIKDLKVILSLFAVPIFVFSIYFIAHYFGSIIDYDGGRLGEFFGNVNDVGLNLYIGFVMTLTLAFMYKKYWLIPFAIPIGASSFLTGSRKVLILLILFILLLIIVLLRKKKFVLIVILAIFAAAFIFLFSLPALEDIKKRFLAMFNLFTGEAVDGSTASRYELLKDSIFLASKSLLLGYGGGGFAAHSSFGVYAHNNFGEVLCDFGIFGVLVFYIPYPLIGHFTNKKNITHVIINYTFLITFILCSFTTVFFDTKIYYLLFALSLFLIKDINSLTNENENIILSTYLDKVVGFVKHPIEKLKAKRESAFMKQNASLDDENYLKKVYKFKFGRELNLDDPETFNEKLQWLKLYDRNPRYVNLVDKYEVRGFVQSQIGASHLVPLIGVWDKPEDIDFSSLPNKFVLKCTHNSGLGMCICKDKQSLSIQKVIQDLNNGLNEDFYLRGREWPYKDVRRRIICEEFLEESSGKELSDYKLFCFNGEFKVLLICSDRHSKLSNDWYDKDLNHLPCINGPKNRKRHVEISKTIGKMIKYAEKLSKGIPQARIDFYDLNGKIYFGEITLFESSGLSPFKPEEYDKIFGSYIQLPKRDLK